VFERRRKGARTRAAEACAKCARANAGETLPKDRTPIRAAIAPFI
jgi:hypothetical protein